MMADGDTLRLVAWRAGRTWTQWHIVAGLRTRCGITIPSRTPAHPQTYADLKVGAWHEVCSSCRAAVVLRPDPPPPRAA